MYTVNVIKALQQLENGGLASTAGPYQGDCFTGLQRQRKVLQGSLARPGRIVKTHMIKLHGQALIGFW